MPGVIIDLDDIVIQAGASVTVLFNGDKVLDGLEARLLEPGSPVSGGGSPQAVVSKGSANFHGVPAGVWKVSVQGTLVRLSSDTINVEDGRDTVVTVDVQNQGRILLGRVSLVGSGRGLDNVSVRVGGTAIAATTNSIGEFTIEVPKDGEVRLNVFDTQWRAMPKNITLTSYPAHLLEVALEPTASVELLGDTASVDACILLPEAGYAAVGVDRPREIDRRGSRLFVSGAVFGGNVVVPVTHGGQLFEFALPQRVRVRPGTSGEASCITFAALNTTVQLLPRTNVVEKRMATVRVLAWLGMDDGKDRRSIRDASDLSSACYGGSSRWLIVKQYRVGVGERMEVVLPRDSDGRFALSAGDGLGCAWWITSEQWDRMTGQIEVAPIGPK
jgi:hypothetical protein